MRSRPRGYVVQGSFVCKGGDGRLERNDVSIPVQDIVFIRQVHPRVISGKTAVTSEKHLPSSLKRISWLTLSRNLASHEGTPVDACR